MLSISVPISIETAQGIYSLTDPSNGVGVGEWPDWFDGFEQTHRWDEESGAYRGVFPSGVQTVTITVKFTGEHVTAMVNGLLHHIGRTGDEVVFNVTTPVGTRSLSTRFVAPGKPKWYPRPHSAVYAELPLQFEVVNPDWLGADYVVELGRTDLGIIDLPNGGPVESWPTIIITGQHTGVTIRMRYTDVAVPIPHHAGGLVVTTDPQERGVHQLDTGLLQPGAAVFWPEPPAVTPTGQSILLTATGAGADFKAVVKFTERWLRAW